MTTPSTRLIRFALNCGIDAATMSVESIFFKHEETRSKEYADQFDMMLSEQLEKELPMTNCWHCHTPYAFTTTKCPKCNATNANVDFETAQIEQVKELC